MKRLIGVGCAWILATSTALGTEVTFSTEDAEAAANVRLAVSGLSPDEDGWIAPPRLVRAVGDALKPFGYYAAQVSVTQEGRQQRVLVTLGRRILLSAPDITIRGSAREDPEVKRLLDAVPPSGTPLKHRDYEDFKAALTRLTLAKGYFDAEFRRSRLEVSVKNASARWVIDWDSGERWRFGRTVFQGSQIEVARLNALQSFQSGDAFEAEKVADLSRRLSETGWFESVAVTPRFKEAQDHELPLLAAVAARAKNEVELGLAVDSDVGLNGEVNWTRPWINRRGQSLKFTGGASTKEQSLTGQWKLPQASDPLNDYWTVSAGYKHTDLNDTRSQNVTMAVARTDVLSSGWQRTPSVTMSHSRFTQANTDESTFLLYPGLSFSRVRQRGGLSPDWGDSQRYSVEVSRTEWGSGVDFAILRLQDGVLRTWRGRHRFLGRLTLGWITTDDLDKVPPEKRFFAGGDKSVRGYGYQKISPRDDEDQLIGASKLATGSVEYQYRVTNGWWAAAFLDAGDAVRRLSEWNLKKGAGFGVRWESPVGPVKFDLAWPLGDDSESGLHFYVGLGAQW